MSALLRRTLRRPDDGSILPLIAVFGALCLALVLLVAAATDLYLERKRLFTLADGAALVGAETFRLDTVRRTGPARFAVRPRLESEEVRAGVEAFVGSRPADEFQGLRLESAVTPDHRSALVTLSAQWRPPVVSVFVPDGFRIQTTARARSIFG